VTQVLITSLRTSDRQLLHRHPDHHSRSLLAQFGLTPKSKRGLALKEAGDRLAQDQPAEITMFQILEVKEPPAFNGGRKATASAAVLNSKPHRYVFRLRFRTGLDSFIVFCFELLKSLEQLNTGNS